MIHPAKHPRGLTILLVLILSVHLIQCLSPLRLNTDGIYYLQLGLSLFDGDGLTIDGYPTHFPAGYPLILYGLLKLNLAHPAIFVLINCLALVLMIAATYALCRRLEFSERTSLTICITVSLSAVIIKHMTLPMPETLFTATSLWAVVCLIDRRHVMAVALIVASVLLRTAGVALIPAFLYVAINPYRHKLSAVGKWVWVGAFVVFAVTIGLSRYFREALDVINVRGFIMATIGHLRELGEVTANIPVSKMPSVVAWLVPAFGLTVAIVLFCGFLLVKFSPAHIYFAAYILMIALWPYYDPRFWLPVIPLLLIWIAACGQRFELRMKPFIIAFYLVAGLLALAYSTRLSLSGERFPDLFGDGRLRDTYKQAMGLPHDAEQINADATVIFNRYGLH